MQVERQMRHLGQHAVDAGAHGDGVFPGLDVQVAGAEADGVLHQAVDQDADLEALGGHFGLEILNGVTHIENLIRDSPGSEASRRAEQYSRAVILARVPPIKQCDPGPSGLHQARQSVGRDASPRRPLPRKHGRFGETSLPTLGCNCELDAALPEMREEPKEKREDRGVFSLSGRGFRLVRQLIISVNRGPARQVEQRGAENQEEEDDRVDLEREIKARMDQAPAERQPHQQDKAPPAVNPSARKPAQHHHRECQSDQRAADPAERDARFQPVVVQLRRPIAAVEIR